MNAFQELITNLLPAISVGVGLIVAIAVTVGANALQKRTNIVIEQADRDALHKALTTGVMSAIARLGEGAPVSQLRQEAMTYAERSVPDAIKRLKPKEDVIKSLAASKVQQVVELKKTT